MPSGSERSPPSAAAGWGYAGKRVGRTSRLRPRRRRLRSRRRTGTFRCPNLDHDLFIFGFRPVPVGAVGHQPDLELQGNGPAPRADARLPAGRRRAPHADEPRVRRAPGPHRRAHGALARLPHALGAVRRRPGGLDRRADAAAVHLLLPAARPGHVHVALPLRGRRARADGHDGIVFVRPAQDGTRRCIRPGVRVQRRRRLDRLRPPLRAAPERALADPHDNGERIQETIWTDYDPDYWTINGRVYPADDRCRRPRPIRHDSNPAPQPISSLDPVQPRRARPPAAREPRLPAARDAAPRNPDEGRRRGRDAPPQPGRRRHLLPDEHPLHRARRGARRDLRRARLHDRTPRSRSDGHGQLQHVPVQEPRLLEAEQQRRARPRRHGHRGTRLQPRNPVPPTGEPNQTYL